MNLHENQNTFAELIQLSAVRFNILPIYVEKDYWITRSLQRIIQNQHADQVVFKGGTSLSKAYHLTNRFSEDIDVAILNADAISGNQLKIRIKNLAKEMASGLQEVVIPEVTSKGSRFYKAVYRYPNLTGLTASAVQAGQLLIEINTYANPYPYVQEEISSFVADYLVAIGRLDLMQKYNLSPFTLNVLDKRQTLIEKLVALLRFSFSTNPTIALAGKIRHFYDLYYLANDAACAKYIRSADFQQHLSDLFTHDQREFDEPHGWQAKVIPESPLVSDFPSLWKTLRSAYQNELIYLAFSKIPDERLIAESFYGNDKTGCQIKVPFAHNGRGVEINQNQNRNCASSGFLKALLWFKNR